MVREKMESPMKDTKEQLNAWYHSLSLYGMKSFSLQKSGLAKIKIEWKFFKTIIIFNV